jgi:hypothetical protein
MKDFSLLSLYAIMQDMLGWLFWPAVVGAVLIAVLFLFALRRPVNGNFRRGRSAMGLGIIGAAIAVALAPYVTQASFANIHGAVDWITLGLIAAGTFVAVAIAAFALLSLKSQSA